MEEILDRLHNLDNVQLRAELLKYGERVGPVTPTTRRLFLSKLARKVFLVAHPEADLEIQKTSTQSDIADRDFSAAGLQSAEMTGKALLTSTSISRKLFSDKYGEKGEPCIYYVVLSADTASGTISGGTVTLTGHRVFTEKLEALAFMKKSIGSRLKVFHSSDDVKYFLTQLPLTEVPKNLSEGNESKAVIEAEKSAFKGPRIQELVQFRKLIEKGDVSAIRSKAWNNPRYLITGADTPVILHEGMRHNALHIAAKANQPDIALEILEILHDPEFTKLLYNSSHDTEQSREERIVYLVDLYLNSPDKGGAETPLHIACKMGHAAIVRSLVLYSATDRTRINKYGEKPAEIICSRYKGDRSAAVKEEIQELLKGLCVVPLLRSQDNITLPVVGAPCSPNKKIRLNGAPATPSYALSPKEPFLMISAYAGPMSPSKAEDFHKQWMNPRCLRDVARAKDIAAARRADAEKGYERIGRKLARQLQVPWSEYWQFLDAFVDFSTQEGLHKLEEYLQKQQALLSILAAMQTGSSEDRTSSTCESEGDSQQESFFTCDEDSADEKNDSDVSLMGYKQKSDMTEVAAEIGPDSDNVAEDDLDIFFDAQSFIFGQRLQLKKTNKNNGTHQTGKDTKVVDELKANGSNKQNKKCDENSSPWSYRDALGKGDVEQKPLETSDVNDSMKLNSVDSSDDCPDDKLSESYQGEEKQTVGNEAGGIWTKSFNSVMAELSDKLEAKLVFSPEGKMVTAHSLPDIGLCLDNKDLAKEMCKLNRRDCPLDIVIRQRKGTKFFSADVLFRTSHICSENNDEHWDDSISDFVNQQSWNVLTDVKVVAKNEALFECLWHTFHPIRVTVGILEPWMDNVTQHCGYFSARIVHRKKHKSHKTACFIYGRRPSKTDLDVMRAVCDSQIDSAAFPAVHSWLALISATQQEGRDSWPSPMKLRHQQHLLQFSNQSLFGSPVAVSPLVQGGTVTSTPVSRTVFSSISCNRDLSPERPALLTSPRAWLFKSC